MLTLGRDPAITAGFLAQLNSARPGAFNAYTAHSAEEFEALAVQHREEIQLVLLGAAQTDEQAAVARSVVSEIWGLAEEEQGRAQGGDGDGDRDGGMRFLRLPAELLTEEGKNGGMLRWFLERVGDDGAVGT